MKKQTWIKNLSRPQLCSGSRTRSYQGLIFHSSLSVLVVLVLGSVPLASLFLPCFTADVLSVSCSANQIIMMEHSPTELLFPFFILSSKTLSIPKPCCSLSHRTDLSSQYSSAFHPFFSPCFLFFPSCPPFLFNWSEVICGVVTALQKSRHQGCQALLTTTSDLYSLESHPHKMPASGKMKLKGLRPRDKL